MIFLTRGCAVFAEPFQPLSVVRGEFLLQLAVFLRRQKNVVIFSVKPGGGGGHRFTYTPTYTPTYTYTFTYRYTYTITYTYTYSFRCRCLPGICRHCFGFASGCKTALAACFRTLGTDTVVFFSITVQTFLNKGKHHIRLGPQLLRQDAGLHVGKHCLDDAARLRVRQAVHLFAQIRIQNKTVSHGQPPYSLLWWKYNTYVQKSQLTPNRSFWWLNKWGEGCIMGENKRYPWHFHHSEPEPGNCQFSKHHFLSRRRKAHRSSISGRRRMP